MLDQQYFTFLLLAPRSVLFILLMRYVDHATKNRESCFNGYALFTEKYCQRHVKRRHLPSLIHTAHSVDDFRDICSYYDVLNVTRKCSNLFYTFTDILLCRAQVQYATLRMFRRARIDVPHNITRYENQFLVRDPCMGMQPSQRKSTVPSYAQAQWFELNSIGGPALAASKYIHQVGQLNSSVAIGIHIRRGDACMSWSNVSLGHSSCRTSKGYVRPCYPLAVYMNAAIQMRQLYGADHVIIITDSDAILPELEEYQHIFRFVFNLFDRSMVGGRPGISVGKRGKALIKNWIERRNDSMAARLVQHSSLIADLKLIRRADIFIGSRCSSLTPLVLNLIQSRTGTIPPYAFID